jgi:hypothetical protein
MKKIALLTAIIIGLSMAPAQAKPKYWKPLDKKGLVHKICDNGNLVYIYKNGYAGGISVVKGGCW